MKGFKRILSITLVVLLITQLSVVSFALTGVQKQNIEKIVGVYDGSYTATQGITGLTLSIYNTKELLSDDALLQKYADVASSCGVSGGVNDFFTKEDIKRIISQHSGEYIALFNFFPMVDENGVGPNPDVEEGLYTMTVNFNESTGKYDFVGSQWIQHDTYRFVDLIDVEFKDDVLEGEVYGDQESLFWTDYNDLGDVSVSSGKGHSGYRIDFENASASLSVSEQLQIKAIVKNNDGVPATDKAKIKWFSNDESVAVVNGENWGDSGFRYALGTITGVSEGVTEIYAELDNKRVATCTVVVSENKIAAPLKISTSYELVSQIVSSTEGNITTYRFAPNYKITAEVVNSDTNPVDNVLVRLNLPETAQLYGEGQSEYRIDELGSNESASLSWSIVVEGQVYDSTNIQYSISALSDQSEEITEHKTIFVEPFLGQDNRISFDTDVWDFVNSSKYYNNGHYINSEYYNSLINAVSNIEKERIDSYLKSEWNGSCYGMVVISALTKIGRLQPSDYHSGVSVLKDFPSPKKSDEIYCLITYYHMTQRLDSYYTALNENMKLDEKQRLIALVNAVEKVKVGGTPVLLSIFYMTKDYDIHSLNNDYFTGHAILAYDVEYGSFKVKNPVDKSRCEYDKRVLIYDPNDNKHPLYLYINSDFTNWTVDGYCQNRTKDDGLYWYEGEGYFSFVDDSLVMDSINVEDSKDNYYSRLVANTNTQLRINMKSKDGNREQFEVHGMNIFDRIKANVIAYVEDLAGDGATNEFGYFFPDDAESLLIVPSNTGEETSLSYQYPGVMYSVNAQNSGSIEFSEQNFVKADCNGSFVISATYNEGFYATPWYHYSVSGVTDGSIGISKNEEGYTIISGDNLDGLTLTVRGTEGEKVQILRTTEDDLMIKNSEDKIVLMTDTDNDGDFETPIKELDNKQPVSSLDDTDEEDAEGSSHWLYIGIGAGIVILTTIVVLVVVKKRSK